MNDERVTIKWDDLPAQGEPVLSLSDDKIWRIVKAVTYNRAAEQEARIYAKLIELGWKPPSDIVRGDKG